MHRYTISKRLGDGSFGEVVKAVCKQSGEVSRAIDCILLLKPPSDLCDLWAVNSGSGNQTDEKEVL